MVSFVSDLALAAKLSNAVLPNSAVAVTLQMSYQAVLQGLFDLHQLVFGLVKIIASLVVPLPAVVFKAVLLPLPSFALYQATWQFQQ